MPGSSDNNFTIGSSIQKVSKEWLQSRMKNAGWWAITPDNPGINPPPVDKGGLMNAIPGTDPAEGRYSGDLPADIMGDTLAAINQAYLDEWGRPACPEEMKAVFDFVYGGYEGAPEYYLPKDKTVNLRMAARRFVADGYFSVGEEVLFGKYKNKRGKIVAFGKDDRGIPTVEIEPIPKGRKQNRMMGLYKIWKVPAERTKEACIVFSKKCDGDIILGKVRDRMYDPDICIYHLEIDGTEMCVMFDRITGFCEGINEHGIGVVNSTLMVLQDAREGLTQDGGEPERSPDGVKILKALTYDKVGDVIESLILHKPKRFRRGLKGHTFVSDGNNIFALENTRIHAPKSMKLDSDKVHTRTNHGIFYPGAGYTKGVDYLSSIVRRWEAQKQLEKAQHAEDLMPALTQCVEKVPSVFSPTRFTDKMRTTSQLALDPKNGRILLYIVPEHAKFLGIRNLLPGGRKPKLRAQLFKYPGKEKLQDGSITVPEEMSVDSVKREKAEPALKPERVAARYKSKKKVKTKDGDEMTVYEYSDQQVAERDRKKAERIEKLRKSMEKLRTTVRKDVKSKDEKLRDSAIAVGLMDETFERPGNDDSASDGHFGVTTWKVKFLKFKPGSVTVSYVGKSDVDQKKKITNSRLVNALKAVCKDKKPEDCVLSVSADDVNEYLEPFDITAKDIRGFHANREMKEQLKRARKGPIPKDPKEREKKLKAEFDKALEATAKRVGHEPSTLKSQYLVPGLEEDYKRDGTINESHTKKGAEAVTDTASFYVIAPEALKGMLDDTDWLELAHDLWPGEGRLSEHGVGDLVPEMERHVRESGGAVLNTGWDGGFDVGVKGKYPDAGGSPVPFDLPIREKGALPPYGLRQAAEQGTETERRILANALHAPILVARTRDWWLREAPNVYRFAREHEKPRPEIQGLKFPPDLFTILWYEDAEGNRLEMPKEPEHPEGAQYQHSQFPHVLRHSILRLNDDGTSSEVAVGESSFSEDLVNAMIRSGDWDVGDAIMVASQSCGRCGNVLANHYGLEGYAADSDEFEKCNTRCGMCEHHDKAATKSDAEVEEELVQKMLRKEPKKKPPRYDLRDNRTLDEEDEEENLGGGDQGDRDLSLKWNKVAAGRRVAFRWLALPRNASATRLALRFEAREPPAEEAVTEEAPTKKRERPTFEQWVKEKRWPSKAKGAPPGAEVGFEGLKKQDPRAAEQVRAEYKRQFGVTEEEEKEKAKKEEPEEERTRADIDADLYAARDALDEIDEAIEELQSTVRESKKNIKTLRGVLKEMPESVRPERIEELQEKIKEQRRAIHEAEDGLDDKKAERKDAQRLVDELKEERRDPTGAKHKKEEARRKERSKKVKEAVEKTTRALSSLLGEDSALPKAVKDQIADQLGDLDETLLEQFALDFENDLKDLVEQGPMAADSIRMANAVAKMGFSTEGITDPEELAKRTAQIAFARNVVANPMVTAGKPVGRMEMPTAAEYGARAKEGFQQFQKLNPKLRAEAGARIKQELRGLDEDSDRAKELNALLTGIATAQVVDTGDSLPGRPQPSKGATALIRSLVEQGEIDQVFAPTEDMFSEDSQKAYENALGGMSDTDLAEFIIGDDENHPFYWMKEVLTEWEGGDEYKEFLKDFLREDFMQDMWADRAFRDVMEADGLRDADDPEIRARLTEEAKRENGARLEEAHKAMDRISDAMGRGEEPDPKDIEIARYLDPEVGVALQENAGSVLDKIKETFKSKVVSPALAVLNHFRNTGEADVKKTETLPHPDESAKEPRPKAEREKARAEVLAPEWAAEKPEDAEATARKERVKLKALRQKLKAQRGKVGPEQQAKIDEKLKAVDERLKAVPAEKKPEEVGKPKTREEYRKKFEGSTYGDESGEWHVGDLIHLAETTKEVEQVPISELEGALKEIESDEEVGSKEWNERVQKADLKHPVILLREPDGKLTIADGFHRAWKARAWDAPLKARILERSDLEGLEQVTDEDRKKWEGEEAEVPEKAEEPKKVEEAPKVNKRRLERLKEVRDTAKEKLKGLSGEVRAKLEGRIEQVDRIIEKVEKGIEPEKPERKSPLEKLKALREKAKARLKKLTPSARKRLGEKLKKLNQLIGRQEEEAAKDEEHGPGDVWQTEAGNWRAKNQKGVPHSFKDKEKAEAYAESKEEQKEEWSAAFDVPVPERGPTKFASEKVAEEVAEVWLTYIRSFHPDDPDRPIVHLDAA